LTFFEARKAIEIFLSSLHEFKEVLPFFCLCAIGPVELIDVLKLGIRHFELGFKPLITAHPDRMESGLLFYFLPNAHAKFPHVDVKCVFH